LKVNDLRQFKQFEDLPLPKWQSEEGLGQQLPARASARFEVVPEISELIAILGDEYFKGAGFQINKDSVNDLKVLPSLP
jgi:hypothetical protein